MRMFVAIELDAAMKDAIVAEQQHVALLLSRKSELRFTDRTQLHLTLAFLGEITPEIAERVIETMQQPILGVRPFVMGIGALGVFPPHGTPRILWVSVSGGVREVKALHDEVSRRIADVGVKLEEREFRAHITIGRWRPGRPSHRPRTSGSVPPIGTMMVERVTLFESRLSSQGASHHPLAQALLAHT